MPSACIHVFSGTGNSLNAANILEGRLDCAGYATRFVRIGHGGIPPLEAFDLHVVVFPVYALDVPDIVLRYLRLLPDGRGAEAVVVATIGRLFEKSRVPGDGGDEGGALEHVRKLLLRKGYDVTLTDAVSFPSNVTIGRLGAGTSEVPGILRQSDEHVNRIADSILNCERKVKRYLPLVPQAWMLFALLFHGIGRRSIGKMFVANSRCTSCGLCEQSCPVGAIRTVEGRPRWTWQCEGCHRCINTCPQGAIEGSLLRGLTMIVLVFIPYAALLGPVLARAGFILPSEGIAGFLFGLGCWVIGYLLLFAILDVVYSRLERPPVDCPVALFGYTRGANRYVNPSMTAGMEQEKTSNDERNGDAGVAPGCLATSGSWQRHP